MTDCRTNWSFALAYRNAGRPATSVSALWAARVWTSGVIGGEAAAAVPAAMVSVETPAATAVAAATGAAREPGRPDPLGPGRGAVWGSCELTSFPFRRGGRKGRGSAR